MSGPGYPTLCLFEVGQWYDYAGLVLVVVCLAVAAWLAQRYKWFVIAFFIVIPVLLSIFWWPHSTEGTSSAGWFPMVKLYSALLGSLSLVALQYVPKLRHNKYYLLLPPLLLAVNITEAVIRDFQCFSMTGVDPTQGFWCVGGPWNIMNGIAGILNILAISGWMGIYISRKKSKAIIWGDLTVWWIIAYDLWNFAYLYNCMSGHAWYNGFGLLLGCTIPAFMKWGRGAWIQYRAYTLSLWCAFTLSVGEYDSLVCDVVAGVAGECGVGGLSLWADCDAPEEGVEAGSVLRYCQLFAVSEGDGLAGGSAAYCWPVGDECGCSLWG